MSSQKDTAFNNFLGEQKMREVIITLAVFFIIFVVLTTFEFFLVGEMAKNYAESELAIDEAK